MLNVLKAYLQTEGKVDYRDCGISYYTYSMFDTPNRFKVNVNVHIQSENGDTVKTLSLDESFDKENEAIDYGIENGKKFIDSAYISGKVKVTVAQKKPIKATNKDNKKKK